jgi:hypothetical protein
MILRAVFEQPGFPRTVQPAGRFTAGTFYILLIGLGELRHHFRRGIPSAINSLAQGFAVGPF